MQAKAWLMRVYSVLKEHFKDVRVILFGSRARGDNLRDSDYDLIVVSESFRNTPFVERSSIVLEILWENGIRDDIEVLCYTPEEFEKKKKQLGIVAIAVKEGIMIP